MVNFHFDSIDENYQHFVIWSGGADSTLLLHELAERYGTKRKPIKAISVWHDLVDHNKQNSEILKRMRFLEQAKNEGLHIEHLEITVTEKSNVRFGVYTYGLAQMPMWAANIPWYIPKDAYLYFGFIKDDDSWSKIETFNSLLNNSFELLGKEVHVRYPLQHTDKIFIYKELKKRNLLDKFVSCQVLNEDGTDCKWCESCKLKARTLREIEYEEAQSNKNERQIESK